jgi:hypothetical protein
MSAATAIAIIVALIVLIGLFIYGVIRPDHPVDMYR